MTCFQSSSCLDTDADRLLLPYGAAGKERPPQSAPPPRRHLHEKEGERGWWGWRGEWRGGQRVPVQVQNREDGEPRLRRQARRREDGGGWRVPGLRDHRRAPGGGGLHRAGVPVRERASVSSDSTSEGWEEQQQQQQLRRRQ